MKVGDLVRVRVWDRSTPNIMMKESLGIIVKRTLLNPEIDSITTGYEVLLQGTGEKRLYKEAWVHPVKGGENKCE